MSAYEKSDLEFGNFTQPDQINTVSRLRKEIDNLRRSEIRLKQIAESLRESEERYRDLFENVNDLIQCVNPEGRFVYVNRAWRETLEYTEDEIEGLSIIDILDPDCREHCLDIFGHLMAGEKIDKVDVTFITKYGNKIALEGSINTHFSADRPVSSSGIFRNVTSRKQIEDELRALSLTDELTGLYNRRGLTTIAAKVIKVARRLKRRLLLLYADLDDLKVINDNYGHKEGDYALIASAGIFKKSARESDVIARVGGDEFVILTMVSADLDDDTLSRRLHKNLRLYNDSKDHGFKLSLSIGTVRCDPDVKCLIYEMLAAADNKMYKQKKRKLNRERK